MIRAHSQNLRPPQRRETTLAIAMKRAVEKRQTQSAEGER